MRIPILAVLAALAVHGSVTRTELLRRLPVRFEADSGGFAARSAGYKLSLNASGHTLEWAGTRITTRLAGADPSAALQAEGPLAGVSNHFTGSADQWRTNVAAWSRVRHRDVYPGIDLVFHGSGGKLEYDFVVAAGADPSRIRLELSGHNRIEVDSAGDLVIRTGAGDLRWKRPELFQEAAGLRTPVKGRFIVKNRRTVGFEVGPYDRSRELVIDPVLAYSSYFGSGGNEGARGIGVDAAGNVYLAGNTTSSDLPVTGALQPAFGGMTANFASGDAFVAKFTPAGALVYLTYIGGAGDDTASAIFVDGPGNVYLTGATSSQNFPLASAAQSFYGGTGNLGKLRTGDAFVLKLNAAGNRLLYSTLLGGNLDEAGAAITVDAQGNAYVAGATQSLNFPTTENAYQRVHRGSGGNGTQANWTPGDAFVTKYDPSGRVVFSTMLGGGLDDGALAIGVDAAGNVYVGGYTLSTNFPTVVAYQPRYGGEEEQNVFFNFGDGFVSKLNPSGTGLLYSTYVGGFGDDVVSALSVDSAGNAYIAGSTSSKDLKTTPGVIQPAYAGYVTLPFEIEQLFGDAFVGKLNPIGSAFTYLTYLGGAFNDAATAIAVDGSGNAYITGFTNSQNFPTAGGALQSRYGGDGPAGLFRFGDAFLTVVNPAGNLLLYSSYFGARFDEGATSLAIDGKGNVFVAGITISLNLETTPNARQRSYGGAKILEGYAKGDAFYSVFSDFPLNPPAVTAITNAASNAVQPISPGMIFVAYGSGMGPAALTGAALDANGRLASTVAESQMLFDGVPAPVVYTSAGQFAGIVPYSVAGKSSVQVVSVHKGARSAPFTAPVGTSAPALFSENFSGTGQAAAFNQDGTPNSRTNPAAKGSIVVFFGTGEGALNPVVPDGSIAGAPPTWRLTLGTGVTVGGANASVLYSNTAPFSVAGLLQINAQLSNDTPSGSQPVVVTIGNTRSQSGLTIWVQ